MKPNRPQRSRRRHPRQLFETLEVRRLLSTASFETVASTEPVPTSTAALEASSSTDNGSTDAVAATADAAEVVGPSILHTEADFERMRQKVAAGAQPWLAGWNALISDGYSQTGWN